MLRRDTATIHCTGAVIFVAANMRERESLGHVDLVVNIFGLLGEGSLLFDSK